MPAAFAPSRPAAPADPAARPRILRQARTEFFTHGYRGFQMDALAQEIGMSKKTLYVHFAGKDAIVEALIDDLAAEIRADADRLLGNRALNLAEKLRGFVEGMLERMAALHPRTFQDLQRFAPRLYEKIEAMRGQLIPYVFGRFVAAGQGTGLVRSDVPPSFAIEFFLHAMQGLMHPATLERLRLGPPDVIARAIPLFFGGLLTPAGRQQYEKLFPR